MKTRSVILLVVITVVVIVAAAVAVIARHSEESAGFTPEILFHALNQDIAQVTEIDIQSHDAMLGIELKGGKWVLPGHEGYPADEAKVRKLLLSLMTMKAVEPKTDDAKLYDQLDLQDIATPGSKARLLTLKDASGKIIAALLIGKRVEAGETAGAKGQTAYVRRPGDKACWLASNAPQVSLEPKDWMVANLIELNRARIQSVEIRQPDGKVLKVGRADPKQQDFVVENLPRHAKLKSDGEANVIASGLAYITFDDVKRASDVDWAHSVEDAFTTFDGLTVKLDIAAPWAKFTVDYDAKAVDKLKGGTVLPAAPEDGASEAKTLKNQLDGWAYKLPSDQIDGLTQKMSDVVAEPATKSPKPKVKKR